MRGEMPVEAPRAMAETNRIRAGMVAAVRRPKRRRRRTLDRIGTAGYLVVFFALDTWGTPVGRLERGVFPAHPAPAGGSFGSDGAMAAGLVDVDFRFRFDHSGS